MVSFLPIFEMCWLVQAQKQRACQRRKLRPLRRHSREPHSSAVVALADFVSEFGRLDRG